MTGRMLRGVVCALTLAASVAAAAVDSSTSGYDVRCVGQCNSPAAVTPTGGVLLFGGHVSADVAKPDDVASYRWWADRAGRGDLLVLTAYPDDDFDTYNAFLLKKTGANSVTTIRFTSRDAAFLDAVVALARRSHGYFLTGGDQYRYRRFWRDTPMMDAINAGIRSGSKPIGGSSAGMAVLGHYYFQAAHGGVSSRYAMQHPVDRVISMDRDLIRLPQLQYSITDTHFYQRDRMGRAITFLANLIWQDYPPSEQQTIALFAASEHTSIRLDSATNRATFHGDGPAYVLRSVGPAQRIDSSSALTYLEVNVWKAGINDPATSYLDLVPGKPDQWTFAGGHHYHVSVDRGEIQHDPYQW